MAARPDRSPPTARPGVRTVPPVDAFAALGAADQALVSDLLSVFLDDALGATWTDGPATKGEGGEQDAA